MGSFHGKRCRWFRFSLRTLLIALLIFGCIFWAVNLKLQQDYQIVAYLKIEQPPSIGPRSPNNHQATIRSHISNITSPVVTKAALSNSDIAKLSSIKNASDPVTWLQQNISISQPLDSELVQLTLRTKRPEEDVMILNAIIAAYLESLDPSDAKQIKILMPAK